jgi:hypothetical protein
MNRYGRSKNLQSLCAMQQMNDATAKNQQLASCLTHAKRNPIPFSVYSKKTLLLDVLFCNNIYLLGRLQNDFLDIAFLKLITTPSTETNRQPEAGQSVKGAPGTQGENRIMQQLTRILYVIQLEFG